MQACKARWPIVSLVYQTLVSRGAYAFLSWTIQAYSLLCVLANLDRTPRPHSMKV